MIIKKKLAIILALATTIAFAGCGKDKETASTDIVSESVLENISQIDSSYDTSEDKEDMSEGETSEDSSVVSDEADQSEAISDISDTSEYISEASEDISYPDESYISEDVSETQSEEDISDISPDKDELSLSETSGKITLKAIGLSLVQSSLSLSEGEKATLNASVTYNVQKKTIYLMGASDGDIAVESDNEDVATAEIQREDEAVAVVITAEAKGKAVIKITANGSSVSYSLTVSEDETIKWSSSDSEIASVNKGVVTAKSAGKAIITASVSKLSLSCEVVVSAEEKNYDLNGTISANLVDGILTLRGNGAMPDYSKWTSAPWNKESIKKIVIMDGVTNIGTRAFQGCTALENIDIADTVTKIGDYAFSKCSSLKSIFIPASVAKIGSSCLEYCPALEKIEVDKANPFYQSWGNCLCNVNKKNIIAGCKNSVIPTDGRVERVGDDSFRGCSSLKEITIPDSIMSIGWFTFYECTGLKSVSISDSVVSIDDSAFAGCTSLKRVVIPKNVSTIMFGAFWGCTALEEVVFQNTSGWYITPTKDMPHGEDIDVSDSVLMVEWLTDTYYEYYWYRKGVTQ